MLDLVRRWFKIILHLLIKEIPLYRPVFEHGDSYPDPLIKDSIRERALWT